MKRFKVYTKEKGIVETDEYQEIYPLTWHRLDGPAIIEYIEELNISRVWYYINNKSYSKNDYDKEILKLTVNLL